jgi:SAM-dependent methyltransferase
MLAVGSARYPGVSFALGSITRLGLASNSCSGVLSRSSVIHLPPALLSSALTEFARVLVPGGWLLLSFSATDGPEPPYEYYDHRIAGAYRWWPDPEPDDRRQFRVASILARKRRPLSLAARRTSLRG